MNLHEYQAKEILGRYGIFIDPGSLITGDKQTIDIHADKYVVKAQVHSGGRGKAGGVKLVDSKEEALKVAKAMLGTTLYTYQNPDGQFVSSVYVQGAHEIAQEYYLSFIVDRASNCISVIASKEGGVDIETVAQENPESIVKVEIGSYGLQTFHSHRIAKVLGLADGAKLKSFIDMMSKLYKAFVDADMSQLEINPLIVTKDGQLVILDAKIIIDDNALGRQKDIAAMQDDTQHDPLELRAGNAGISYVRMKGSIGCMVNGAGLAMATMDIIKSFGVEPANFLDVGGGADQERVTEAFSIILADQNVRAILVNIFGGIMKCDVIAKGIVAAAKSIGIQVPLVVRLSGTNFESGRQILAESGLNVQVANDLLEAAQKVTSIVPK